MTPTRWRRLPRLARLTAIVTVAVAASVSGGASVAQARIHATAAPFVHDEPAGTPTRPVALVFGVLVHPDGTPSPRLVDRLRGAVELHRTGRVERLVMTGDGLRPGYDEVATMRAWAIDAGVPAEDITVDPAGLDTYDSCLRARTVLGIDRAVLVTQAYHLPRALYLCRHHGIDAVGLAVADWQHHPERSGTQYPLGEQVRHGVREWLARVNATVDVRRRRPAAVTEPV